MEDIEIRVHTEFTDYREKFYGFTLRQIIFGIIMFATVISTYFYTKDTLGEDLASWLVIIIALPIAFVGFIPVQGLDAERIVPFWWRNYIKLVKPLEYKTEKEILAEKNEMSKKYKYLEDGTVVKLSKKERKEKKKYLKSKKKELQRIKKEEKKQQVSEKKTATSKNTDKKLSKIEKRELKKKKKQEKLLKKAQKKFGTSSTSDLVKEEISKEVPQETKDDTILQDEQLPKIEVEKEVEQVPPTEDTKEQQVEDALAIEEALKKFELHETFKKLKPEATEEEFEKFYQFMTKSGEQNEKEKE